MSCDVGKATKGFGNELWRRWSDGNVGEWAELARWIKRRACDELIFQPFRHFTYVTTHSPTLPSLYLRYSLFSNPSVASPTSQFILEPFFRFSYVTSSSVTSPGDPPMGLRGWILSEASVEEINSKVPAMSRPTVYRINVITKVTIELGVPSPQPPYQISVL